MPRSRNLRKNKSNKNRYGEPLWGSITPRKKTPKRTTPIRFTRVGYTPAKIIPSTTQKPRPTVTLHKAPTGYSFIAQKQKKEFRIVEKNKRSNTKAKVLATELPKVKGLKSKKRSKN